MKIELSDKDWGVVMAAMAAHLGRERKISQDAFGMANSIKVARVARIRDSMIRQRRAEKFKGGYTDELGIGVGWGT